MQRIWLHKLATVRSWESAPWPAQRESLEFSFSGSWREARLSQQSPKQAGNEAVYLGQRTGHAGGEAPHRRSGRDMTAGQIALEHLCAMRAAIASLLLLALGAQLSIHACPVRCLVLLQRWATIKAAHAHPGRAAAATLRQTVPRPAHGARRRRSTPGCTRTSATSPCSRRSSGLRTGWTAPSSLLEQQTTLGSAPSHNGRRCSVPQLCLFHCIYMCRSIRRVAHRAVVGQHALVQEGRADAG